MAELDRAAVLNDTKWLFYCLCGGAGIGPLSPLVASDTKQLCLHGTCSTVNIGGDDGLCYAIENFCCITEQFSIPPAAGTPPCICFNKWIGEKRTSGPKSKMGVFDFDQVMNDTFWVYYLFCGGCGVNKMKGPLIQAEFKELCCAGQEGMVPPVEDGIFCSGVGTELCIWSEFQIPPSPNNPCLAICTWRRKKDTATNVAATRTMPPRSAGAPSQAEMA